MTGSNLKSPDFRDECYAEAVADARGHEAGEREDVRRGAAVARDDHVGVPVPDVGATDAERFCADLFKQFSRRLIL